MVRRSSDPASRRLRGFVLLVIFGVALPSLLLSGFGLIAIGNERDAALQRVKDLYGPLARKLAKALEQRLGEVAEAADQPLLELARWGRREVAQPGEVLSRFVHDHGFTTNFFVLGDGGATLVPRPEEPLPSWTGYLPEAFREGLQQEFEQGQPLAAAATYRGLLSDLRGTEPAACLVQNAFARSLAAAGREAESIEALGKLCSDCPSFIDGAGYNLALGASLRRLGLLAKGSREWQNEAGRLAERLSDPRLPASPGQVRFVARRALALIREAPAKSGSGVAARLAAVADREELLRIFAGRKIEAGEKPRPLSIDADGGRRLVLLQREGILAGCEVVPGALEPVLQDLLRTLEADAGIRATIAPSSSASSEPGGGGIQAASVVLTGALSDWRVELWLSGSEALDQLARSRTQLYVWLLSMLVLVLLMGISWLVVATVREARLTRLKTDFVSSVSHELRTPLTSIRMFVDTLLLGRVHDNEEARECLQIIGQESERLSRLVERILDFSRMEAGRRAYRFRPEPVEALVHAAVDACRPQLELKKIAVEQDLPADLPEVPVDRDALVEVLINLLTNAIKYSRESGTVRVTARREGDQLLLSVVDSGIGIPRSEQKRIFEKFYRVDNPVTAQVPGSGLGLSLVRYIVTGHGGEVRVDSAPGKGSRFTVRLPLSREGAG